MADYVKAMKLVETIQAQLPELSKHSGMSYSKTTHNPVTAIEDLHFILADIKKFMLFKYGEEMYDVPDGPIEEQYEHFTRSKSTEHKPLVEEGLPSMSEEVLPEESSGDTGVRDQTATDG